jgi:hypothetical protein
MGYIRWSLFVVVDQYVRICWIIFNDLQGVEVRKEREFYFTGKVLLVALKTMKDITTTCFPCSHLSRFHFALFSNNNAIKHTAYLIEYNRRNISMMQFLWSESVTTSTIYGTVAFEHGNNCVN